MTGDTVRCRKCRKILLTNLESLLNAHGQKYQGGRERTEDTGCTLLIENSCLYISEDSYSQFITDALDTSSWTKGKLNCPGCQARIGSFNYVSGSRCTCGDYIVPQVHLLASKVDVRHAGDILPHPISRPDCPAVLTQADKENLTLIADSEQGSSDHNSHASLPAPVLQHLCDEENHTSTAKPGNMQLQDSIENIPPMLHVSYQSDPSKKRSQIQARLRQIQKQVLSTENDLQLKPKRDSSLHVLTSSDKESSGEEEDQRRLEDIPPDLTCSVCIDLLYSPFIAKPCGHVFCEPCLRRLARPNPTKTYCPLCRQIIGQCMLARDLAAEAREKFPDLYKERHKFEQTHNIQDTPLPWLKNFRMDQIDSIHRRNLIQMAGGWRPVLLMLAVNALGLGGLVFLKWHLKSQQAEDNENQEEEADVL